MTFLEAIEAALKAEQFEGEYVYIQKTTWRNTCFLRINRNQIGEIRIFEIATAKEPSQVDLIKCDVTASNWQVPDKDPTSSDKS